MTAFADGVLAARGRLRAYALTLRKNPVHADDLVAETICRAFERAQSYQDGSLLGWLTTIMHNLHIDEARRKRELEDPDGKLAGKLSIEAEQFWRACGRDLTAALHGLAPREAAAVIMVCHEGQSYDDAAASLSVSLPAFKTLLHRTKLRLQERLAT